MFVTAMLLLSCASADASGKELAPVELRGVRREPVAAAKHPDVDYVAIACAKSGTLIFWDLKLYQIKQEFKVGEELRGIVGIGLDEFLLIDSKKHELIQVRYASERLTVLHRYPLPTRPIALVRWNHVDNTDSLETYVAISSLWARQVTIWKSARKPKDQRATGELRRFKTIDLPFEPGLLGVASSGGTFLQIAAAFGGEMAAIYPNHIQIVEQPIHNIGSLDSFSTNRFFVTHQRLASQLSTTHDNLLDGKLIENGLGFVELGKQLKKADWTRTPKPVRDPFDTDAPQPEPPPPRERTADPAGIAINWGLANLVCYAGSDEVAIFDREWQFVKQVPAGKRPRTALALNYARQMVLGELDDSLTLFDTSHLKDKADVKDIFVKTVFLDPSSTNRELKPAERGERLFFSAKNSAGQQMSCHSCHPDGHTIGLLADTLGDNTHGTPKRVLSLRGTRLTDPWGWNGEMKSLQDSVQKSLQDTMHAAKIEPRDVDDIVSFLHTLPPVPPLKPVTKDESDREQVARGEKIFNREGCAVCHVPPLTFTSNAAYDVGLEDEKGLKKFNPPSLRGVGRLKRLFHDNRASSLVDVFESHGHQLKAALPAGELADLVRYLESL